MDYCKLYFNKSINDLQYQDVVNFFVDPKEESTKLEFKGYSTQFGNFNSNLEGVIRGIDAFLNSEGGVLIWGAPIGTTDPSGKKIFQGALSPLSEVKEKDWLINKVSDSITPLPVGINVSILKDGNNVVYIFEIQTSQYSPHQFKNVYWARLDGQTKPAPHYLIDALFKKISFPNIEGFIKFDEVSNDGRNYFLNITILLFNFSQLQNEEKVSFRLMCPQGIFTRALETQFAEMYNYDGHQLVFKDFIDILHFGAPNMHSERLLFNPYQLLNQYKNMVELVLSFGGKYSPMKVSTYELDFSRIDWNNRNNPNYLISELEENSLSSDKQNQLGTTREDSLRTILNR